MGDEIGFFLLTSSLVIFTNTVAFIVADIVHAFGVSLVISFVVLLGSVITFGGFIATNIFHILFIFNSFVFPFVRIISRFLGLYSLEQFLVIHCNPHQLFFPTSLMEAELPLGMGHLVQMLAIDFAELVITILRFLHDDGDFFEKNLILSIDTLVFVFKYLFF